MRSFLKKYIKPSLCVIGIYRPIYRGYFFILKMKVGIINKCAILFTKTCPILLYHRIDTVNRDPLSLAVTPKCFEEHLRFLKDNYEVLPLSILSERLVNNQIKGNEAAITFDDGYKDNLTNALPLLEKYNLPATIFITTRLIGQRASFRWDMEYKNADRATFLNEEEIKSLGNHPLIEIGAHTDTHTRMSDLSYKDQREDILKGKVRLEEIVGRKIRIFAYPFGGFHDFTKLTKKIVKEVGFIYAYSNTQNIATAQYDRFNIPRINIRECTIPLLSKRLMLRKVNLQN